MVFPESVKCPPFHAQCLDRSTQETEFSLTAQCECTLHSDATNISVLYRRMEFDTRVGF